MFCIGMNHMKLMLLGLLVSAACMSCAGKPQSSATPAAAVNEGECRDNTAHAKPIARISEWIWSDALSDQRLRVMDTITVYADGGYVECLRHYAKWSEPPDHRRGTLPVELVTKLCEPPTGRRVFNLVNGVRQAEVGVDDGGMRSTPPVVDSIIEYVSASQDLQSLMFIARDHQATDDDVFRAIVDMKAADRRGQCQTLWTDIANDDSYSPTRRRWAAKQTLRLVTRGMTLGYVGDMLDGATWLKREKMGVVTEVFGHIPLSLPGGDEVFWIGFPTYDRAIYFNVIGKPALDDVFASLQGRNSPAAGVVVNEIGFGGIEETENELIRPLPSPQTKPAVAVD